MISLADYFKAYAGYPEITPEIEANAADLLAKHGALMAYAVADGWKPQVNPVTGTMVSGDQNGGWRPQACPIGAPDSTHKKGKAVDTHDPGRRLASWCMANLDRLRDLGLYMEDPRWTAWKKGGGGWVHLQSVPPRSGKLVYIPSTADAIAGNPAPWGAA